MELRAIGCTLRVKGNLIVDISGNLVLYTFGNLFHGHLLLGEVG